MRMNTRSYVGKQPAACWSALLCLLFLGLGWAMIPTASAHAAPRVVRPLGGMCDYALLQVATSANTVGDITYIDYPPLNGHPTARLFVTQVWNPSGHFFGVYNDHPIGVWFDALKGKWTIFNEDLAAMPSQAAFYVDFNIGGCTAFFDLTFTTQAGAVFGDTGVLDNIETNGYPNLPLLVTQQWQGVYNPHPVGLRYSTKEQEWGVVNLDGAPMPVGATFTVAAIIPGYGYTQTTTATNTSGDSSVMGTGEAPQGTLWVTLLPGARDPHNIGVWFNFSLNTWELFNEDLAPMPLGVNYTVKEL